MSSATGFRGDSPSGKMGSESYMRTKQAMGWRGEEYPSESRVNSSLTQRKLGASLQQEGHWNDFLREHKGSGHTTTELTKKFKAMKQLRLHAPEKKIELIQFRKTDLSLTREPSEISKDVLKYPDSQSVSPNEIIVQKKPPPSLDEVLQLDEQQWKGNKRIVRRLRRQIKFDKVDREELDNSEWETVSNKGEFASLEKLHEVLEEVLQPSVQASRQNKPKRKACKASRSLVISRQIESIVKSLMADDLTVLTLADQGKELSSLLQKADSMQRQSQIRLEKAIQLTNLCQTFFDMKALARPQKMDMGNTRNDLRIAEKAIELDSAVINDSPYRYCEIGHGSFGTVVSGSYNGKKVAVKILRDKIRPQDMAVFEKEMGILNKCDHATVIHYFGYVVLDENENNDAKSRNFGESRKVGLVMELLSGGDVTNVLYGREGGLSIAEKQRILYSMAKGLDYIHTQGLAHRDVKPANVLVDRDITRTKLCDFGFSYFRARSASISRIMMPVIPDESEPYKAPEVLAGELNAANVLGWQKADIYSFALVAFEIVTGIEPRDFKSVICSVGERKVSMKGRAKKRKEVRQIVDMLPDALTELLSSCLRNAASERPTMTEVVRTLERISAGYVPSQADEVLSKATQHQLNLEGYKPKKMLHDSGEDVGEQAFIISVRH